MIKDYFRIGFSNLAKRRLRTWLTMIGIFIGMALVVFILSMGTGLQKYIDDEFAKLGRDKLIIMPKGTYGPGTSGEVILNDDDVRVIKRTKGVVDAAGMILRTGKIEFNDEIRYYYVTGIPVAGDEARLVEELFISYGMEEGRAIGPGDNTKINMGHYYLDRQLFGKNIQLRDTVKVNEKEFKVIGFYELIGNPSDDTNVYMTKEALMGVLDMKIPEYDELIVKSAKGVDPLTVKAAVEKSLRRHRGLEEGKEDFSVTTVEQLMESFNVILLTVRVVLGGLAFISLIVGGIGIMNTMFTSVMERTREIGIMKAIGARNSNILTLFLIESGILGFVGGLIGILLGAGIAKLLEFVLVNFAQITFLKAYFPWYYMVGVLVFSFVAGTISGLFPAWQASKMNPVDSLRYE